MISWSFISSSRTGLVSRKRAEAAVPHTERDKLRPGAETNSWLFGATRPGSPARVAIFPDDNVAMKQS